MARSAFDRERREPRIEILRFPVRKQQGRKDREIEPAFTSGWYPRLRERFCQHRSIEGRMEGDWNCAVHEDGQFPKYLRSRIPAELCLGTETVHEDVVHATWL